MAIKNRTELATLLAQTILEGGRRTTADKLTEMIEALVESCPNISADKNQPDGYAGLDSSGKMTASQLAQSPSNGSIFTDAGTFKKRRATAASFDGDGGTTDFTVAHGLGVTPTVVLITPTSNNGAALFYISTKDATNFTVKYKIAPIVGTGNVTFDWEAWE
jgi:hypothetical protein